MPTAPFDLVYLLFNFQGLEVVEFRFVGLELCMELVLAGFFLLVIRRHIVIKVYRCHTYRLIPLEKNDSSALVTRGQIISRVIELDGGDDVS